MHHNNAAFMVMLSRVPVGDINARTAIVCSSILSQSVPWIENGREVRPIEVERCY